MTEGRGNATDCVDSLILILCPETVSEGHQSLVGLAAVKLKPTTLRPTGYQLQQYEQNSAERNGAKGTYTVVLREAGAAYLSGTGMALTNSKKKQLLAAIASGKCWQ